MSSKTETDAKNYAPIVIVAAMGQNTRVIGKENKLLWHVPADLQRFKELTLGHPVIMGRKTFESILDILGKPLPGRTNIVVTRQADYAAEGAVVAHSLAAALDIAQSEHPTEIHIGGGEQLYRQSLPHVSRLHLTFFADEPAGDTFFPDFAADFIATAEHPAQTHQDLSFQWVDYKRK